MTLCFACGVQQVLVVASWYNPINKIPPKNFVKHCEDINLPGKSVHRSWSELQLTVIVCLLHHIFERGRGFLQCKEHIMKVSDKGELDQEHFEM